MQAIFKCKGCEHDNTINENNTDVYEAKCLEDDKMLKVTGFTCAKCGEEHTMQLDDEKSQELLEQVTDLLKKKLIAARQSKNVNNRQKKAFKKRRNALTLYRIGLMDTYNGKLFVNGYGVEFEMNCAMGELINGEEN